MGNIVMAPTSGPPSPDMSASAVVGADKANGKLFGMLISAAMKHHGSEKDGHKKADANPTDPTSMIMAAIMQYASLFGSIHSDDKPAQQQDQTTGNPAVDGVQAASGTAAAAGTAAATLLALLSGGQGGREALLKLLASGDGDGNALSGMLLNAVTGGSGDLAAPTVPDGGGLDKLLAAITGAAGSEAQATPAVAQGSAQALDEIRKLFADLVSQEATAQTQVTKTGSADDTDAPTAQTEPQAVGAAGEDGSVRELLLGLARYAALHNMQNARAAAGKDAGAEEHGAAKADQTAISLGGDAEQKKTAVDFAAAFKPYGGETARPAEALPAASYEASVKKSASQAFDNIVDTITSLQGSAKKEMEINLKPDFLGKVVIKLSMDEGGLVAKIAASNPKVQDALLGQVSSLQSSLAEQGLKDVRIVVTSGSVQDAALQQQSDRRQQGNRERSRHGQAIQGVPEQQQAGQSMLAYEQYYKTGSINYLA